MSQTQIAEKLQIIQDGINTEGELIGQIAAALKGKGKEENSIETCSMSFSNFGLTECNIVFVFAETYENGQKQIYMYTHDDANLNDQIYDLTINNVICGTPIVFAFDQYQSGSRNIPYYEISGDAVLKGTSVFDIMPESTDYAACFISLFTAPNTPNQNCTINFCYEG